MNPSGPFGLSEGQIERYARHLILPELGGRGQRLLLDAEIALVGTEEAAEEAAYFLAAAGVGRLSLDASLLARIGAHLSALNPDTTVTASDDHRREAVTVGGASRLAGSIIALQIICRLVGIGPEGAWDLATPFSDGDPQASGGRP